MPKLLPFFSDNKILEAGCDEAGRGCLSGPVVASAVILNGEYQLSGINDSKKINPKKRKELKELIESSKAFFGVGFVSPEEIDEINILNASILAMHRALDQLEKKPNFIIVDGNKFKQYENIPHECIVKGDGKYQSIAAASILAKTYRDEYMLKAHIKYPIYSWDKNKGYPTLEHRKSVLRNGLSPLHRKSFKIKENQLSMEF